MSELQRVPKAEWHVLLADDDDDYSLIIERALRAAAGVPVEIRRARTGEEALALLRDSVPDLLLLDLKMPGMGGHRALEEIKKDDALRSVAVAILSSSDRDEDVAKSYGLGGNHFITKPSSPLELEAKLAGLLRNLTELKGIRRGSSGSSTTAVSAVDPHSMAALKALRWVAVVGVLIALYVFGKVSGAF
jgi:CheY-like chemotaxis protein